MGYLKSQAYKNIYRDYIIIIVIIILLEIFFIFKKNYKNFKGYSILIMEGLANKAFKVRVNKGNTIDKDGLYNLIINYIVFNKEKENNWGVLDIIMEVRVENRTLSFEKF